jgi:Uma2 family endonuclease
MSVAEVITVPLLGPHANGMLLTPEEFDAAEDWEPGYRYELVNGVLIVNPPPGFGERRPNDELGYILLLYQETHPQGAALNDTVSEHTIKTKSNRRRADRAIWAGLDEFSNPDNTTPTIICEFVGKSSRDRKRDYVVERQEYREIGIEEYWIIDRYRRILTVYRGGSEIVIQAGQTYTTPLLPGFELPLDRLLFHADRAVDSDEYDEYA